MLANRIRIPHKPLLIGAGVILLAAVAMIFYLGRVTRSHRVEVHRELSRLLGSEVTFESVSAGLWSGFSAKKFRVADDPRFAATPFLEAEELRLGLSWWHLLLGRVVINSLTFTRPELQIITDEDGLLNVSVLAERKKDLLALPRLRAGASDRRDSRLNFLLTRVKVIDGRIDFIDRSISAPAELQIKRVDLEVGGIGVAPRLRVEVGASLAAAMGQDVHIRGEIGPPVVGKTWSQQPLSLEMRFDSLYLPMLARAMPFFRDRIPREFDITGPMFLETRLAGTFEEPRFDSATLKVPFLGSSEYNAVLEGRAEIRRDQNWGEAPIAGTLTLNHINLTQLRKLPVMRQLIPDELTTGGVIDVRTRFEGTWNHLRLGALLDARESELRFREWLAKPEGRQAQLRAQLTGRETGYELHPSELRLGELKALVSGTVRTRGRDPRLIVRLKAAETSADALAPFVAGGYVVPGAGTVDCDLVFERDLQAAPGGWHIQGGVRLDQLELRHRTTGQSIDRISGSMRFFGRRARADNVSFRIGSSIASAAFVVNEINPLHLRYGLRSGRLALADIPLPQKLSGILNDVLSQGELRFDEVPRLDAIVTSPAGILDRTAYRGLQTEIAWSPEEISFTELRMNAFGGVLRAAGGLQVSPGGEISEVRFAPATEALSLNELIAWLAPGLKDRFHGQVDFRGDFAATVLADSAPWQTLRGSGAGMIRDGSITDFNLLARLFSQAGAEVEASRLSDELQARLARSDTPVQELKAAIIADQQRVSADNLSLVTSDYEITGAGWVSFDGTTQWKGVLTFSSAVSRELQLQYAAIRYFLDRKGRLSIGFRADGKLPNIRFRPDNRALAKALRWGTSQRRDDLTTGREGRGGKTWLPDSLERLLHR
jgi:hypothetical protein